MKPWCTALLLLASSVASAGCGRVGFDSVPNDAGVDGTGAPDAAPAPDAACLPTGSEGPAGDPSCSDGVDNDCDALPDESDPDCVVCMVVTTATDEADTNETAIPPHLSTGLSLREAITLANLNDGADCILFEAPMAITLLSSLPDIVGLGALRIDGAENVIIEDTTDTVSQALKIDSNANTIAGLHFRGFSGAGGHAIDVRASGNVIGPGVEIESCGTGVRVEAMNTTITGNKLHSNEIHGIQLFDLTANTEVSFNQLYLNLQAGIQAKASTGLVLRHNTLYGNLVGLATRGLASDLTVENNIFVANTQSGIDGREAMQLDVNFSSFFDNDIDCQGCTIGPNSITADPALADPANGNFSLTATSPAIDVGIDTGLDTNGAAAGLFNGSGPDLGAIEFSP